MGNELNFLQSLNDLIGLECWGVTGGEGTGSIISLDIGNKILKNKPSKNPHLSELVSKYKSSHGFMLHCPWRIETNKKILSGSFMPNDNDGMMVSGLNKVIGTTIKKVTCIKPAYDLLIEFSNETNLVASCSNIGIDDEECYTYHSLNEWFTIKYGGEVAYEKTHNK